ncbi:vWA domain-containing protein [Pseudonocardia sp.]|uniref:vWA domain-containing protein n=1 Tax=Pseudonocardia sp. TaxID=60912 RepID=UPI003D11E399
MTGADVSRPARRGGARHDVLARARDARRRRTGRIADDVVVFAELLRSCGVAVPGGAPARAVRALGEIALDRRADVQAAMRTTLVSDRPSTRLFDLVFPVFWSRGDDVATPTADTTAGDTAAPAGGGGGPPERGDAGDDGHRRGDERTPRPTASRGRGEPTPVTPIDAEEIDTEVRRIVRALARSPGRRRRSAPTGELLDLRASLRHGLRSGELVELVHSRPRPGRAEVAVLCDVSSSMAPTTGLFLAVTHALARHARLVEAGVFHVELTLVGAELRRHPPDIAVRRLTARAGALSGGTRIGHCVRAFVDAVEPELTPRTVVFVLSDGWDVGEPDLLAAQLRRLRERVGRVVWCDPHAAATGFEPQVRGLRAALPHVDDHLDLSGPAALSGVADHLERHQRNPGGPT